MTAVIVLDPGHGGWDPGSIQYDGGHECDYTIALARSVQSELLKRYECEVLLTHEGSGCTPGRNVDAELRARAEVANNASANLFVSLHHDGGPATARGGSLWVWTSRGMYLPGSQHTAPRSYACAQKMEPILKEALAEIGIPWRGLLSADFGVLRYFNGPGVLIETHFGTNPQDDDLMDDPANVQRLAEGIARAIAAAVGLKPKPQPAPAGTVLYRVIIDGTQVGAFRERPNILRAVEKALDGGAQEVKLQKVCK